LAERRAEGNLVDARPPGCRQRGRRAALWIAKADRGERGAAFEHDVEDVRERLDVVDHGGLAEKPLLDGEGGLVARLPAKAFDRVEERRLLAADVGAGAAPHLDFESERGAEDAGTEVPVRERRGDRGSDARERLGILAADVEIAGLASRRVRGDRHGLTIGTGPPRGEAILESAGSDSSALQTR
jgi:hypothetical protein